MAENKNIKQQYPDFDEYIRQGEPDQKEKAGYWQTAIGLQAVDGLKVSDYLQDNTFVLWGLMWTTTSLPIILGISAMRLYSPTTAMWQKA